MLENPDMFIGWVTVLGFSLLIATGCLCGVYAIVRFTIWVMTLHCPTHPKEQ
jgi:hypothetical protein